MQLDVTLIVLSKSLHCRSVGSGPNEKVVMKQTEVGLVLQPLRHHGSSFQRVVMFFQEVTKRKKGTSGGYCSQLHGDHVMPSFGPSTRCNWKVCRCRLEKFGKLKWSRVPQKVTDHQPSLRPGRNLPSRENPVVHHPTLLLDCHDGS
jgi:hypothetical protein